MQEKLEMIELEKSLVNLKQLSEKMNHTLTSINTIVKDNINTGTGIWDSDLAADYRARWDTLMDEFPTVLYTFKQQEANLEIFINNMKKVEER